MSQYQEYNNDFEVTEIGFPSTLIPEDRKGEEYHKAWAKAMYSKWHKGNTAIPYDYQTKIDTYRAYGAGSQDISQYLKSDGVQAGSSGSIDGNGTDSATLKKDRRGNKNIDHDIISVAPRVKSMIKAYLHNIREDISVDTIDPKSGIEKDNLKYKAYLRAIDGGFSKQFERRAGLVPDKTNFDPETVDELEMFDLAGGFKLVYAADMERLVQYSIELSGYEEELEEELYDDLMDIGVACTKKKLDPEDLKFKDVYIDPKFLVVEDSKKNDFTDAGFHGHVEFYTISKLRKFIPDMSESEFAQMAYSYRDKLGNPGSWEKYNKQLSLGSYGYDDFQVAVFEAEWLDSEHEEAVFYTNKNGKMTQLPVTEETVKGLGSSKEYVKSNLHKLRQACLVVGTEYVFDWGPVNIQERDGDSKTVSNYNIRALSDAPLIVQIKPILDDLQISWIRFQENRKSAAKRGYAINISKLKSISDGTTKYDIGEVLKMWKEEGLLMYQDSVTGRYEGGKTLPVDQLPDTLIDEVQEFVMSWDHALKRMEDLTGVNSLMLGATPDPNNPVTTEKMSVASSANAIKPLAKALNGIKRNSAKSFMRRFVLAVKARPDIVKSYEGVIGKSGIERLKSADKSMVDYGMFFHPRPTDAEKQEFKQAAMLSMNNKKEGRQGIDLQTYQFLLEQLYAGVNLKMLRFYLGAAEKRIKREEEENKMKMIEAQGQQNIQLEKAKEKAQINANRYKTQGESHVEGVKGKNQILVELAKVDPGLAMQIAERMGMKATQPIEQPAGQPQQQP